MKNMFNVTTVLPHSLLQTNPCIRHNFSTQVFRKRAAQLRYEALSCATFSDLLWKTFSFKNSHKKKSHDLISGLWGGHNLPPSWRSGNRCDITPRLNVSYRKSRNTIAVCGRAPVCKLSVSKEPTLYQSAHEIVSESLLHSLFLHKTIQLSPFDLQSTARCPPFYKLVISIAFSMSYNIHSHVCNIDTMMLQF